MAATKLTRKQIDRLEWIVNQEREKKIQAVNFDSNNAIEEFTKKWDAVLDRSIVERINKVLSTPNIISHLKRELKARSKGTVQTAQRNSRIHCQSEWNATIQGYEIKPMISSYTRDISVGARLFPVREEKAFNARMKKDYEASVGGKQKKSRKAIVAINKAADELISNIILGDIPDIMAKIEEFKATKFDIS